MGLGVGRLCTCTHTHTHTPYGIWQPPSISTNLGMSMHMPCARVGPTGPYRIGEGHPAFLCSMHVFTASSPTHRCPAVQSSTVHDSNPPGNTCCLQPACLQYVAAASCLPACLLPSHSLPPSVSSCIRQASPLAAISPSPAAIGPLLCGHPPQTAAQQPAAGRRRTSCSS